MRDDLNVLQVINSGWGWGFIHRHVTVAGTFDRGSADRFVGDVEEAVEERERERDYI